MKKGSQTGNQPNDTVTKRSLPSVLARMKDAVNAQLVESNITRSVSALVLAVCQHVDLAMEESHSALLENLIDVKQTAGAASYDATEAKGAASKAAESAKTAQETVQSQSETVLSCVKDRVLNLFASGKTEGSEGTEGSEVITTLVKFATGTLPGLLGDIKSLKSSVKTLQEAPVTSTEPTISANEVTQLRQEVADLQDQVAQLNESLVLINTNIAGIIDLTGGE